MISTVSHCAEIQRLVVDTTPTVGDSKLRKTKTKSSIRNPSTSTSEPPFRPTYTPFNINATSPSKKRVVSKLGIYEIPRGFGRPVRFRGWGD